MSENKLVRESELLHKTEKEAIEYAEQRDYKLLVKRRNGSPCVMRAIVGEKVIEVEIEENKVSRVITMGTYI